MIILMIAPPEASYRAEGFLITSIFSILLLGISFSTWFISVYCEGFPSIIIDTEALPAIAIRSWVIIKPGTFCSTSKAVLPAEAGLLATFTINLSTRCSKNGFCAVTVTSSSCLVLVVKIIVGTTTSSFCRAKGCEKVLL